MFLPVLHEMGGPCGLDRHGWGRNLEGLVPTQAYMFSVLSLGRQHACI